MSGVLSCLRSAVCEAMVSWLKVSCTPDGTGSEVANYDYGQHQYDAPSLADRIGGVARQAGPGINPFFVLVLVEALLAVVGIFLVNSILNPSTTTTTTQVTLTVIFFNVANK